MGGQVSQTIKDDAIAMQLRAENERLKEQLSKMKSEEKSSVGDEWKSATPDKKHRPTSMNFKSRKGSHIQGTTVNKVRRGEVSAEVAEEDDGKEYVEKVIEKSAVEKSALIKAVSDSLLFESLREEEREACVLAFEKEDVQKTKAGQRVITQGEKGDKFYVIVKGSVQCKLNQPDNSVIPVGPAIKEGSFGDLALMYNQPRAAHVDCIDDCELFSLHRNDFRAIVLHYKRLRSKKYEKFLKGCELLKELNPQQISKVSDALEEEEVEKDQDIILQGSKGDHFYLIASGKVEFFIDGESKGFAEEGSFFGERALLKEEVRAATVRAVTDGMLLSMDRHHFVKLLGSLTDLHNEESKDSEKLGSKELRAQLRKDIPFDQLEIRQTLGCGAFGRVKLVKFKDQYFALKCLIKNDIRFNNLEQHVMNERDVMLELDHPFILKLYATYWDKKYLYFLLELCIGGELFTFLRKYTHFSEKASRFYSGSVVLAFELMHSANICYRDLKPENLILDRDGVLKVVDFGLAKRVVDRTWTLCGTPDYLAPEIILSKGHNKAVDYWALGVLLYEMCAGFVPFYSEDVMEVYQLILQHDLKFPSHFSRNLIDLITKLMHPNASKRLGVLRGGCDLIKKHKWYGGFNWTKLIEKKISPPIKPECKSEADTKNFDSYGDDDQDAPDCDWEPDF
eukprot:g956.t1